MSLIFPINSQFKQLVCTQSLGNTYSIKMSNDDFVNQVFITSSLNMNYYGNETALVSY